MNWFGHSWFGWWMLFVMLFFLIPLFYGWAYRGWGPWYRRKNSASATNPPPSTPVDDPGWGWISIVMWVILVIAIVWLLAGWGLGARW